MNYKIIFFLFLLNINACVNQTYTKNDTSYLNTKNFSNRGFTLIYSDELYEKKLLEGKISNRSLILFQKDLKKNSMVKITNLKNSKYIIAKVGNSIKYPYFYNSVISKRISETLEINESEPYVEIKVINENLSFVAKKAKTFDEERVVANKAPIDSVSVNNLNDNEKIINANEKSNFNYSIKIADFYFIESANTMIDKVKNQTNIKNVKIKKISNTQYRVFLGPFNNLNSLKKAFNDIYILNFENIEIIKNDEIT